jgi:hypothetical protein
MLKRSQRTKDSITYLKLSLIFCAVKKDKSGGEEKFEIGSQNLASLGLDINAQYTQFSSIVFFDPIHDGSSLDAGQSEW